MPPGYLETKLLPWSWAETRLEQARNYWIATTDASGRPHARPVWGVWRRGALHFGTGGRIAANLTRNPEVSVNLESGDECVILEGRASPVEDVASLEPVVALYNAKYRWEMEPSAGEFWIVRPRRAFGWLCDGTGSDGGAVFSQTATRWSFDG